MTAKSAGHQRPGQSATKHFSQSVDPPPLDLDTIASAFQQTPIMIVALEGAELRVAAWNTAGETLLRPVLGGLGASAWEPSWIEDIGADEPLRRVLETGEPFTIFRWRPAFPNSSGTVSRGRLDLTFTAWRRADDSIRGVIVSANVSGASGRRESLQATADAWQERFEVSRDAMIALQAALLPASVPILPGLQIAARYMLADSDSAAGGDWFSAYPTISGRVALVVGDVVGHGVTASATMGQLRAVIKERLRSGAPLTAAMEALDHHAETVPGADATTICAALLNAATGELEYCTAGHPPPLLVHDDSWRFLEQTGAGPLGSGLPFETRTLRMPEHALLVLYSDGLIERPGIPRAASTVEIGQVIADALAGKPIKDSAPTNGADRVCELSLDQLTRTSGMADDITMLAIHRIDPVADLAVHLTNHPGLSAACVQYLERWLDEIGADRPDRLNLRHAVLELVANSVEHGFTDSPRDAAIELSGHLAETGEVVIDLDDNGQWQEPDRTAGDNQGNRFRGLGLPLARQLLDSLTVRHDQTGTRVRIRHRLQRPAPIVDTIESRMSAAALPSLDDELELIASTADPDLLIVRGPLLATTAERLRTRLDIASRAGTRTLTVNLNDVTHLTSVAVRVLQQAQRSSRRHDQQLVLKARPGTIAHAVLGILAIPLLGMQ